MVHYVQLPVDKSLMRKTLGNLKSQAVKLHNALEHSVQGQLFSLNSLLTLHMPT